MTLNQRAVFTLGVGYGAASMARLGLWPGGQSPAEPPPPAVRPASGSPGRSPRRRVEEDEAVLLILLR
jgi:hypothetical protein